MHVLQYCTEVRIQSQGFFLRSVQNISRGVARSRGKQLLRYTHRIQVHCTALHQMNFLMIPDPGGFTLLQGPSR